MKNNTLVISKVKSIDSSYLEEILKECKQNVYLGGIEQPDEALSWLTGAPEQKLTKQIESQLIENNRNYSRYPSDYIHALMSMHAFNKDLKENDECSFKKNKTHKYIKYSVTKMAALKFIWIKSIRM